MASITTSGIGSGVDVNGLVEQLVAAEKGPAETRLTIRETETQAKLSAFGVLKSVFSDFQSALTTMQAASTFSGRSSISSDTDAFVADAETSADVGKYSIEVTRLAQSHKLISGEFEDGASASVGSGQLTISVAGSAFDVDIDSNADTLADVRDAINSSSGNTGVTASLINVDGAGGDTVSKLMLTADATGEDNRITVTVDDDDGSDTNDAGLSQLAYDTDGGVEQLSQVQAPGTNLDAEIEIDEQTVSSSSNTFSDVIDGVTITARQVSSDGAGTLDISLDEANLRTRIGGFINAHNEMLDALNGLSSYNADSGQTGILFTDATLRTVKLQIRQTIGDSVSGLSSDSSSLSAIGITSDSNGFLRIGVPSGDGNLSTSAFDNALDNNFDDMEALFAGDDGIATRLDGLLEGYIGSGGVIDSTTGGLEETLTSISNDRLTLDRRMADLEARLQSQFIAMDSLVAQLRTTGDFLQQQLASLNLLTQGNQ